MHRANDADIVDAPGKVRHQIRKPDPRLTVLCELERAPHQSAYLFRYGQIGGNLVEVGLSVVLVQERLGVEQVHLAGTAVHEQMDDGSRLGRQVRLARLQVIDAGRALRRLRGKNILAQQRGKRGAAQAVRHRSEKIPPGGPNRARRSELFVQRHHSPQSIYRKAAELISMWQNSVRAWCELWGASCAKRASAFRLA